MKKIARIVWKNEGRDNEGVEFGPTYAEGENGGVIKNWSWQPYTTAYGIAKSLGVDLLEV